MRAISLKTLKSGHHHGEGSSQNNPLSQLNLTSAQQTDELGQIDNVLTAAQQQKLVSLFSGDTTPSTSTASGNVISTMA